MGQILPRSKIDWKDWERRPPEEQRDLLSKWAKKFKVEAVSATDRNVKKGNHLVVARFGYTHHLICTEVQGDHITAMEYGLQNHFELSAEEAFELLADLENLGKVHKMTLTFEQLENMQVKKRVWPKKLRRYNAKDSVKRAETREGEKKYNCLTNNCEHFVAWCICGLSISLQVKNWYTWAKEFGKLLCFTIREWLLLLLSVMPYSNSLSLEVSFDILSQPFANVIAGFAIVVQLWLFLHEVRKAIADRKSQDIATDHELDATLVEIIAKKWFQLNLGAAGLCFGLPYSNLVALVGIVVGNRLGVTAKSYVKTDLGNSLGTINRFRWLYPISLILVHRFFYILIVIL